MPTRSVDISFTVCLYFLCVCMVTDFSAKDKASSVKFYSVVHRRPRLGSTHFGNFAVPEAQYWPANRPAHALNYK